MAAATTRWIRFLSGPVCPSILSLLLLLLLLLLLPPPGRLVANLHLFLPGLVPLSSSLDSGFLDIIRYRNTANGSVSDIAKRTAGDSSRQIQIRHPVHPSEPHAVDHSLKSKPCYISICTKRRLCSTPPTRATSRDSTGMCEIHYTLYACGCWKPLPQPGTKTMLRLCKVSESNRLDMPCKEKDGLEHKVVNRSQGMCDSCLWKKISK